MIKSMTGFGRGAHLQSDFKLEVDAKSINHRYCDISVRLPRDLAFMEHQIRKIILRQFARGHFDIWIRLEWINCSQRQLKLDIDLARQYISALSTLQKETGLIGEVSLNLVGHNQHLFQITEPETNMGEDMPAAVEQALQQALDQLIVMRMEEGQAIAREIAFTAQQIQNMVLLIQQRYPQAIQEFREKLSSRIKDMAKTPEISAERLSQEVVIFAERSDIREELIRCLSHLHQLNIFLQSNEPMGKKLDFLVQEMNREINTIGSKISDTIITQQVIEVRSCLEKIREQLQNVE